jgi:hypothetical protein
VVCLLTRPEKMELLEQFYTTIRPWGFWGPVYGRCRRQDESFRANHDFRRDAFNILVGIVWQIAMVALPMYLVIQQYGRMAICLAIFVATSIVLKFTWYDRLGPGEMYMTPDGNAK